jgi:hypothetical protein
MLVYFVVPQHSVNVACPLIENHSALNLLRKSRLHPLTNRRTVLSSSEGDQYLSIDRVMKEYIRSIFSLGASLFPTRASYLTSSTDIVIKILIGIGWANTQDRRSCGIEGMGPCFHRSYTPLSSSIKAILI